MSEARGVARGLLDAVRRAAYPLTGAADEYGPLLGLVGEARVGLLGAASHGTHEFYRARAEITQQLIREQGFTAVAVEADWPDAYRVNCFVRGAGRDGSADEALDDFKRFPTWMWRNADVLDFVCWLREHNDQLPDERKVGLYGLDLYSLHGSIRAVLGYLDKTDPEAAARARYRYGCFDDFGEDTHAYGYAAGFGLRDSCEREAIEQLVELQRQASEAARRDGGVAADELFYAEQNARLVKNAEEYYRTMFRGRVSSWNLRDRHMADTLDALAGHLSARGQRAKVVVWAHNSHLGDARATDMGAGGEWTLGQLARARHGRAVVNVGFTTYAGTVTAASNWDEPPQRKRVRAGLPESYEALFHDVGVPRFFLGLRDAPEHLALGLRQQRLERAIGVIYRPETERISHYFGARLPDQFDAVIHVDETRAVEPLERTAGWETGDAPQTYPVAV